MLERNTLMIKQIIKQIIKQKIEQVIEQKIEQKLEQAIEEIIKEMSEDMNDPKRHVKTDHIPSAKPIPPEELKVINGFINKTWKTTDKTIRETQKTEDTSKDKYYPGEGKEFEYYIDENNDKTFTKVKVRIVKGRFESEAEIEDAYFRVVGDALVSSPIMIKSGDPGLAFSEILTLNEKGDTMTHDLSFSDDNQGSWVCVD